MKMRSIYTVPGRAFHTLPLRLPVDYIINGDHLSLFFMFYLIPFHRIALLNHTQVVEHRFRPCQHGGSKEKYKSTVFFPITKTLLKTSISAPPHTRPQLSHRDVRIHLHPYVVMNNVRVGPRSFRSTSYSLRLSRPFVLLRRIHCHRQSILLTSLGWRA